jgi:hypothetical protein
MSPAQVAPRGLRPQDPLPHVAGDTQSPSAVHVDLQAPTPQVNGKQETAMGTTQAPDPSQVPCGVSVVPPAGQLASRQAVPCPWSWQAPASHLPFVPQVWGASVGQISAGSGASFATLVHTPIEPASAQDRHALLHTEVQHTPCAQNPEPHSEPTEQKAPIGLTPQLRFVQKVPGSQFASAVQASKQRLPLHANGEHASEDGALHFPIASQVASGVNTPFTQRSDAHAVPGRYFRQALAPSHFPSVPQVEGSWVAHIMCGSSLPAGTGVQAPSEEGSLQLRHAPTQAFSQHTPSTQKLFTHSLAAPQGRPLGFLPQLPSMHALPATQSASTVQRLLHAPSAQR